jgi:hypothetical protein
LWEFGVALALEGLNRRDEARAAFERALSRTELLEETRSALADVWLLVRSLPDANRIEAMRARIAHHAAQFAAFGPS